VISYKNITLRAAKNSNCNIIHSEIMVDSIDSAEALSFIDSYKDTYVICAWDPKEKKAIDDWKGFFSVISYPKGGQWVVKKLIFGKDINRTDIDQALTITLTSEQSRKLSLMPSQNRLSFIKSIAGDLVHSYKMWFVSCEKPLVDEGFESMMKHGNIEYISSPDQSSYDYCYVDDEDDWKKEIAMQAGMMGGCSAYNDTIC
jgi:hypothetical protein